MLLDSLIFLQGKQEGRGRSQEMGMQDCCTMWHIPRAMKEKDFALFLAYVATLKVPGNLFRFLGTL